MRVADLVLAEPSRVANRSFLISSWLIEIRSAASDAGLLPDWQQMVDALVVAGVTRLAPYSEQQQQTASCNSRRTSSHRRGGCESANSIVKNMTAQGGDAARDQIYEQAQVVGFQMGGLVKLEPKVDRDGFSVAWALPPDLA